MFDKFLWDGQIRSLHRLSIGEADGAGGSPGGGGAAQGGDPNSGAGTTQSGQQQQQGSQGTFNAPSQPQQRVDPSAMFGGGNQQTQQANQQGQQQQQGQQNQQQGGQQQGQQTYGERYTKTSQDVFTPFLAGQRNGVQTLDALTANTDIGTTASLVYATVDKFGSDPEFLNRLSEVHPQALEAVIQRMGYVKQQGGQQQQQQQQQRQPIVQQQQSPPPIVIPNLEEYGLTADHPLTKTLGSLAERVAASEAQNQQLMDKLNGVVNQNTQQNEQTVRAQSEKVVDAHIDSKIKELANLGNEHQNLYLEMFDSISMKFNRDHQAVEYYEEMMKQKALGNPWKEQTARENLQARLNVFIDQTVRTTAGHLLKQNQNLQNQVGQNRGRLDPISNGAGVAANNNNGNNGRIGSLTSWVRAQAKQSSF